MIFLAFVLFCAFVSASHIVPKATEIELATTLVIYTTVSTETEVTSSTTTQVSTTTPQPCAGGYGDECLAPIEVVTEQSTIVITFLSKIISTITTSGTCPVGSTQFIYTTTMPTKAVS